MKTQKVLAAGIMVLLASAGSAYAGTVQIDGSYTTSYTATAGNGPTITDDLSHSFVENLTLGTPSSDLNFFTASPAFSCGYNCVNNTASGTITVNFTFTDPTGATGNLTETGTYEAKYGGTPLSCTTSGPGDTDCIDWSNTNDPIVVKFSDGDTLDVTLLNAQDWNITPEISFDLTAPTATPLPPALSLFAGGLGMFGLLGSRRKRKAAAAVA